MNIEEIKRKTLPVLATYHPTRVGVFGSAARGQMRPDSDVDMLIELDSRYSLFDFIGLEQALGDALGRKVDLVEYRALKPLIRASILSEAIDII